VIASVGISWYVARAGGLLAYLLLTVSVVLGLTLSGRARLPHWPRFAVEDVHRFAGLLTGWFLAIHVLALVADSYLPFSLTAVLVPGAAPYRPVSVALGVVAAELLVALALTNHFRDRLSYRFWRRAHYANFAVWLLALIHGIASGTDRSAPWAISLYTVSVAAVAGLTTWRALKPPITSARTGICG
jgi:predicted ferric reductase